jgi:hypothetical protein
MNKRKRDSDEEEDPHVQGAKVSKNLKDTSEIDGFEPEEFDLDKIPLDCFGILFGKRRRGKTVWLQWLLSFYWMYYPSGGYVFTRTKNNQFWQQHFPEECIFDGFQPDVIRSIIEEQKKRCEQFKQRGTPDECPYVMIIMDDIIADTHLNYEEELLNLAFAGRHYKLCVWITSQDAKGIGPKLRSQADIIGLSYTTSKRVMESVKDDYAYLFEDHRMLPELIKRHTKDHQFLMIDQSDAKYSVEELFFVSKAPDPKKHPAPVYKVGSDKFWMEKNCDWKRQLGECKNKFKKDDYDKKKWLKIAKSQARAEKDEKDDMMDRFTHSSQYMASERDQAAYSAEFKSKYDDYFTSRELINEFKQKLASGYKRTKV